MPLKAGFSIKYAFGPLFGVRVEVDPKWDAVSTIFSEEAIPVALRAIRKFSEEVVTEAKVIFARRMREGGHNATGQLSQSLEGYYPHYANFQPRGPKGRFRRGIPTGLYLSIGFVERPASALPKHYGKLPREYAYNFELGSRPAKQYTDNLGFYRILHWVEVKGIRPRFDEYQAGHFMRPASVETVAFAIWHKILKKGVKGKRVLYRTTEELKGYIENNAESIARDAVAELLRKIGA